MVDGLSGLSAIIARLPEPGVYLAANMERFFPAGNHHRITNYHTAGSYDCVQQRYGFIPQDPLIYVIAGATLAISKPGKAIAD